MCTSASVWVYGMYVGGVRGSRGGQESVLDPPELELQVVMELPNMDVGTELRSYARASIDLNPLSISPALNLGDYQIENSSKGWLGNKHSPYGTARNLRIIKRK